MKTQIKAWTRQAYDNTPYKDDYLTKGRPAQEPSIVPQVVGEGSPIHHVIYIIKENRTYVQVFGDIAKEHQWVLFDNLYCDGEVSVDGHSWSNSANRYRLQRKDMAGQLWRP